MKNVLTNSKDLFCRYTAEKFRGELSTQSGEKRSVGQDKELGVKKNFYKQAIVPTVT